MKKFGWVEVTADGDWMAGGTLQRKGLWKKALAESNRGVRSRIVGERKRNRFFAAMMTWRIFIARKYRWREGEGEKLNLIEHL